MAKRKLITFKYAFGGNSEAIKNYITSEALLKEFRKEYSRLRDAERKQIERLNASPDFKTMQSAQQKLAPKLEEFYTPKGKFKKSEFANEFAKMQRFLASERRTLTGQGEIRKKTINKLQARGYDVTTENYAEFVELMEELRRRGLDELYDSKRVIKSYFALKGNQSASPAQMNKFFNKLKQNYSGNNLDDVE